MMISCSPADAFVTELSDLFVRLGHAHYGEDVSQLEHALQTAHHAHVDGAPPALIAAALLHDVGHMMQKAGEDAAARGVDTRHEPLRAGHPSRGFRPDGPAPVRLHAAAARHSCAAPPGALAAHSQPAPQRPALQGGPMSPAEVADFLAEPAALAALRLRGYDELGKAPEVEVAGFEAYRELLCGLINRQGL